MGTKETQDEFDFFFEEVLESALKLGYSKKQVNVFAFDILECYNNGNSAEECVAEVF